MATKSILARLEAIEQRIASGKPQHFDLVRTRADGTRYSMMIPVPPGVRAGPDVVICRSYGGLHRGDI